MDAVEKDEGIVMRYRKVTQVGHDVATGKVVIRFVEGGESATEGQEVADLIIGADGVKSVVRKGLLGANEAAYAPIYTWVHLL